MDDPNMTHDDSNTNVPQQDDQGGTQHDPMNPPVNPNTGGLPADDSQPTPPVGGGAPMPGEEMPPSEQPEQTPGEQHPVGESGLV